MPSTMTAPQDDNTGRQSRPEAAANTGRGAQFTAGVLAGVLTAWAWTTIHPASWGSAGWLASVIVGCVVAAAVKNR